MEKKTKHSILTAVLLVLTAAFQLVFAVKYLEEGFSGEFYWGEYYDALCEVLCVEAPFLILLLSIGMIVLAIGIVFSEKKAPSIVGLGIMTAVSLIQIIVQYAPWRLAVILCWLLILIGMIAKGWFPLHKFRLVYTYFPLIILIVYSLLGSKVLYLQICIYYFITVLLGSFVMESEEHKDSEKHKKLYGRLHRIGMEGIYVWLCCLAINVVIWNMLQVKSIVLWMNHNEWFLYLISGTEIIMNICMALVIPLAFFYKDTEKKKLYMNLIRHICYSLLLPVVWECMWIYRTTELLNEVSDEEPQIPLAKLLLFVFVPFYCFYWFFKQADRINEWG